MGAKEFKLRMPVEIAEATSANVTAWLEEALTDTSKRLASDPGAGPELLSLRLDEEKVTELANRKRERRHVLLRRLIATHVTIPEQKETKNESAGAVASELIPGKVIPAKLAFTPQKFLPVVQTLDAALLRIYRGMYGLKELKGQKTPEEDLELASAMAECCNRRSPEWVLANADLINLTMASVRWGFAQTEALEKASEGERARRSNGHAPGPAKSADRAEASAAPAPAEEIPSERHISPEMEDALNAPVQLEGAC